MAIVDGGCGRAEHNCLVLGPVGGRWFAVTTDTVGRVRLEDLSTPRGVTDEMAWTGQDPWWFLSAE